jgi:hypothetical protein
LGGSGEVARLEVVNKGELNILFELEPVLSVVVTIKGTILHINRE